MASTCAGNGEVDKKSKENERIQKNRQNAGVLVKKKFKIRKSKVLEKMLNELIDEWEAGSLWGISHPSEFFPDFKSHDLLKDVNSFLDLVQKWKRNGEIVWSFPSGFATGSLLSLKKRLKKIGEDQKAKIQERKDEDQKRDHLAASLQAIGIDPNFFGILEFADLLKNKEKMAEVERVLKLQGFW